MRAVFLLVLALLIAAPASSAGEDPKAVRFQTLRSDKVNVRAGPASNYPIDWVFVRKGMPVEVVASFDTWRKIRDWEGTEGWVHQSMLAGRRGVIVQGKQPRSLRRDSNPTSAIVAILEVGVMGRLLRCEAAGCEIKVDSYRGWLKHEELWGVAPGEVTP